MNGTEKAMDDDRRLDWKSLLLLITAFPVLLSLGFWQLQRAEEKAAILADFEQRRTQPPRWLEQLDQVDNYQPVMVRGKYDQRRYWLLDNRIRDGRFGYELVALLVTGSGNQVLVNLGWLAGDPGRRQLPEVSLPEETQLVSGEVYYPRGGVLGMSEETVVEQWPRVVQWLDMEHLQREFGDSLQPYTVRLESSANPVVNVSPAKHRGYAVQWFAMAAVLLIFSIWRNSRLLVRSRTQ